MKKKVEFSEPLVRPQPGLDAGEPDPETEQRRGSEPEMGSSSQAHPGHTRPVPEVTQRPDAAPESRPLHQNVQDLDPSKNIPVFGSITAGDFHLWFFSHIVHYSSLVSLRHRIFKKSFTFFAYMKIKNLFTTVILICYLFYALLQEM